VGRGLVVEIEKSLRRVKEVVTRPGVFNMVTNQVSVDDYMPNPNNLHIKCGDGLVIYEPKGYCLEMHTAITGKDLPENPIKELHKQWFALSLLGFYSVYCIVVKSNIKASIMCRSAGMKKVFNDELNIYEKVIHGRRWR